ncbi:MAG: hypothetical protein AAF532_13280 [Planctomycetota bacterium]
MSSEPVAAKRAESDSAVTAVSPSVVRGPTSSRRRSIRFLACAVTGGLFCLTGCGDPHAAEIEALASASPEDRRDAVLALRRVDGPITDAVVGALVVATTDADPAVAGGALDALADRRPGPEIDAAILAAVADTRRRVALTAATTAARRGVADEGVIAVLAREAAGGEIAAVIALGQAGPAAASALPTLTRIVTRGDVALLRTQSAVAIGLIGADEATRQVLERVVPQTSGTLRAALQESLAIPTD